MSDCILEKFGYKYEAEFPLTNDPPLAAAEVTLIARVRVDVQIPKGSWVNIVIRKYNHEKLCSPFFERELGCVHGVILEGPAGEVLEAAAEMGALEGGAATESGGYFFPHPEFRPIGLAPWEHFVALRSFVAAIAETGIGILMRATANPADFTLAAPFGFNGAMQARFMKALWEIGGSGAFALIFDYWMELVENAPVEWLASHKAALDEVYRVKNMVDMLRRFAPLDWVIEHADKLQALGGNPVDLDNLSGPEYYREVWGFDPVKDRKYQGGARYFYEDKYPLPNDPLLASRGITLNAYHSGSTSRGPSILILETPIEKHIIELRVPACYVEITVVALPPWERFLALRSNAAAIAELGIANILNDIADFSNESLLAALGFEPKTFYKFAQAYFDVIREMDEEKGMELYMAWFRRFFESTPRQWFKENCAWLANGQYAISGFLRHVREKCSPWWCNYTLDKAQVLISGLKKIRWDSP